MKLTLASAVAMLIAQAPTPPIAEAPFENFAQWGGMGGAMFIIWWLASKTIPKIVDDHKEAARLVADKLDASLAGIKDAIDSGNDKTSTLLQSTLVKLMNDNHKP